MNWSPINIITRAARRWRRHELRRAGATVAFDVQLAGPGIFSGNLRRVSVGRQAYFSRGAVVVVGTNSSEPGNLVIGERVFVNHYAFIDCHFSVTIGDNVLIGPFTYICDFDHAHTPEGRIVREDVGQPVRIDDDVWIGAGVSVLKGVTIGRGAVVGAGAVITKDIPPGAVVVGSMTTRILHSPR